MIMEQWGKDTDRGTRSTRCVKKPSATLSTKDILLLTDFLAVSKFTATVPVFQYIFLNRQTGKRVWIKLVKNMVLW